MDNVVNLFKTLKKAVKVLTANCPRRPYINHIGFI